jgi:hypothetical protein
VAGLLTLLLTESRRPSRTRPDGSLVLLGDQDRARWDQALIAEGQAILRRCLRRDQPGPYQLQAAIDAVHADAPALEQTDWRQILALYDQLLSVALAVSARCQPDAFWAELGSGTSRTRVMAWFSTSSTSSRHPSTSTVSPLPGMRPIRSRTSPARVA